MLVARLQRVDDAEHLGRVAARRGGVGQDEADGLLRVDDEDRADGEGNALGVDVGRVLVVQPASRMSNTSPTLSRAARRRESTYMSYR